MRRVVITGLGIVSCLGNNQDEVKQSLLNSKKEFVLEYVNSTPESTGERRYTFLE